MNILSVEARQWLVEQINNESDRLDVNCDLMKILHGNLTDPLLKKLKSDMPATWKGASDRMMPINFLKRIIDKMTNIYQTGVERVVDPGSDADLDAIDDYVRAVSLNEELNYNNELFNCFGYSLQSIAMDEEGEPYTVAVDNDRFIPINWSANRKNKLDCLVLLMERESDRQIYWIWTNDQFMIMDQFGEIQSDKMLSVFPDAEDPSVNPYGKIPYTYLTKSRTCIMPEIAKDTLQIALIMAVLLSDINYVQKYTAFAILYTVDLEAQGFPQAPNAMWNLSSKEGDMGGETSKPEIGTVKQEGDTDKMITAIQSQLSMWLESWGIRSGGIGSLGSGANFASGVSKIIDEMDISDSREKQTKYYVNFERRYFDTYMHYISPVWRADAFYVGNAHVYSSGAAVVTTFPIQRPVLNRLDVIQEQKAELDAGLTTKKRAIQKVNPEMTEDEVEELMAEIQEESQTQAPPSESVGAQGVGGNIVEKEGENGQNEGEVNEA